MTQKKSTPASLDLLDKLILEAIFELEHDHDDDEDDLPFCDSDCESCDGCDGCDDLDDFDDYPPMYGIPDIESVVFNPPATIVFWEDGTKTVVKCMEGEKFERYAGFAAACMKKMFGSTCRAKAIMDECDREALKRQIEEAEAAPPVPAPAPASKPTERTISAEQFADLVAGAFITTLKAFLESKGTEIKEDKDETSAT